MVGIYKITNPKNKVYIGQSINLTQRENDYKSGKGFEQIKLYNSIKKYGWKNHKFEILEECNIEDLNQRERHYQDHYQVLKKGLNLRLTSTINKSGKMSSHSSKLKSQKNSIPILQYDLNGIFIKRWDSLTQAKNTLNIHNINSVLRGRKNQAGGYVWRYDIGEIPLKIKVNPYGKSRKPILQYDLNGNLVKRWDYIKLAEDKYGDLSSVLKGRTETAYGFKWEYENIETTPLPTPTKKNIKFEKITNRENISKIKNSKSSTKIYKKVKVWKIDKTFIGEFNSPAETNYVLGFGESSILSEILSCCKRKQQICKGYIFQFSDNDESEIIFNSLQSNPKFNIKTILQYDLENNFIKKWGSSVEIEKTYKLEGKRFYSTDIRACCNGKQKTAYGFKWKYDKPSSSYSYPTISQIEERLKTYREIIPSTKSNFQKIYTLIETYYRGKVEKDLIENSIYISQHSLKIILYELKEAWKLPKKQMYNNMVLEQTHNIKLLQIYSDEIENKWDIVSSRILNQLQVTPQKIFARKCIIKEVDPTTKNKFLNENHIQGRDRSKYKFGLYYNEELVSIITFNKPRHSIGKNNQNNKEGIYELLRFCNKKNTNVIGGANKLLQHFVKNYNPINIYSFADNRWSSPLYNVYKTLGFTQTSQSKQGYYYTKDFKNKLHRFNFNKTNLIKKGWGVKEETEYIIMDRMGYKAIYDAGTTRFELDLKNL